MIRWIIFTEQRAGRPRHEVTLYLNPQQRHVRCEDQTAEPFVPCSFAARESQRDDRQSCWGVPQGGRKTPLRCFPSIP